MNNLPSGTVTFLFTDIEADPYEHIEYDQAIAQVRPMLSEAKFNSLWAEGRAMTMEQAIQLALR